MTEQSSREDEPQRPVVVIHTNEQQLLAARVSAHSLKTRSRTPELFDVRILRLDETPHLDKRDGQEYVRWDEERLSVWRRRQADSFAALRRKVPADLGFSGRALVLDPDVFAVGDVYELLTRDMNGKAIICRQRPELRGGRRPYSSAVMLLDCDKLRHWDWERQIDEIFARRMKLGPWLLLLDESPDTIGLFEEEWNHWDTLTSDTKLLHNHEKVTQPWKTGLRTDFGAYAPRGSRPYDWLRRLARRLLRRGGELHYRPHPDAHQEQLFFAMLNECVQAGTITIQDLNTAIGNGYLRKDALDLLEPLA